VKERFSTPVQTGPGAHPAFCIMNMVSFLVGKQLGCSVDRPLPSSAEVKEIAELYLYTMSLLS
jgi:hypothetical protein